MRWSRLRRLFLGTPKAGLQATRARAEAGDAQAQVDMAVTCSRETETAADLDAATAWYRKAAEQNHPQAQFELGMMFAERWGEPGDEIEALRWFRKAAQQGHADAQYEVGVRCRRATFGKPRSNAAEARIEAYTWLWLAAQQGSREAVAAWEQMALDLSGDEVAEGNRRAREFASSNGGSGVHG